MTPPATSEGLPLLSVLIFAPLLVAAVAALLRSERLLRWWALAGTTAVALLSLRLWTGFHAGTADFQFVEHAAWIPWLKINYTLGIDGLSLLLILAIQLAGCNNSPASPSPTPMAMMPRFSMLE